MTTNQPDLFYIEPKKLARTGHPETSRLAARSVDTFAKTHHRNIYVALSALRNGTPYEIAAAAEMEVAAVFRRLNELEKAGFARPIGEVRPSPTGRACRVWEICAPPPVLIE